MFRKYELWRPTVVNLFQANMTPLYTLYNRLKLEKKLSFDYLFEKFRRFDPSITVKEFLGVWGLAQTVRATSRLDAISHMRCTYLEFVEVIARYSHMKCEGTGLSAEPLSKKVKRTIQLLLKNSDGKLEFVKMTERELKQAYYTDLDSESDH